MEDPDDATPEPQRRTLRRGLLWGFAALVVLWLIAAGLQLRAAAMSATDGVDALDSLSDSANGISEVLESIGDPDAELGSAEIAERLEGAASDFADARRDLESPLLAPLRIAPVVGRQLESIESLSAAAETVAARAADAVVELDETLDDSEVDRSTRTEVIARTESILEGFEQDITGLELGPVEKLVGPVRDARNRFEDEYTSLLDTVGETRLAVSGLGSFLDGPTRYVLLGANNAEMRAGSGMVLQAGAMDVLDGNFAMEDLQPTEQMRLEVPVAQSDADLERNWGVLDPDREWRNINLTPRFDVSAAIASDMWTHLTGEQTDGVMLVDIVALAELLELTGPVTLPTGEQISADTVESDLLLDQYLQFEGERDARRDRLGIIAAATFSALNERSVSAGELLEVLRRLGRRRHLLMWSPDPAQQEAWKALGTDGIPDPDDLLLSVINRGGNKLDPFLETSATIRSEPGDETQRVTVDVEVINNTPTGLPSYVAGPLEGTGAAEGEYKGIVALTLPADAGTVAIEGGAPAALGPDGSSTIAATEILVARGQATTVSISFDLPADQESVRILASARVPPTTWTVGDEEFTDARAHRVELPD